MRISLTNLLRHWLVLIALSIGAAGCGSGQTGYIPPPASDAGAPFTRTTPEGATALTWAAFDEIDRLPYRPPGSGASLGLRFVAGQEKLAADLFLALYHRWGEPVFLDLYEAETTHHEAVLWLLGKYGLADPDQGLGPGAFSDPDLQWTYDDGLAYGMESFTQALILGAELAESSIDELEYQLTTRQSARDAVFLYDALLLASHNHLRLFVWWLRRMGVVYAPVWLPYGRYRDIVDRPLERGY